MTESVKTDRSFTLKATLLFSLIFIVFFGSFQRVNAEDLHSIISIETGGLEIHQGDTIYRSDIAQINPFWNVSFNWTENVSSSRTLLVIFRGSFGSLSGGTRQDNVNVFVQNQTFVAGSNFASRQYFSLGDVSIQSGPYTFLIAQIPDGGSSDDVINWFISGGILGVSPVHHTSLSFTYDSRIRSEEIVGGIFAVQNAGHTFMAGDSIKQDELTALNGATDKFWNFSLNWPNAVANSQAVFMVFKGTFGNVPGPLVHGENVGYNFQAIGAGPLTIGKFIDLPSLAATTTEPQTYTVVVFERDPKTTSDVLLAEGLWFKTAGMSGVPPKKYATLTFSISKSVTCCSSIFFIPGFQSSKLYTPGFPSENQLWEPNFTLNQGDIKKLVLNSLGQSVNTIYTKKDDVIKNIYIPLAVDLDVYRTFIDQLDQLKDEKKIKDYSTFAYDWRISPDSIVENGVKYNDGIYFPAVELEKIAASSTTGKVTVVAHSNGGLIAKELIQKLETEGKSGLVDKLIFVATPQFGTPKAIASMLHGEFQDKPLIISKENARTLSENMPGAYALLPSAMYFGKVVDPVIDLSNAPRLKSDSGLSASNGKITDFETFKKFVSANGVRQKPQGNDIETPNTLSGTLLSHANALHDSIDTWIAPQNIQVIQIAGWGLDTPSGISYIEKNKIVCSGVVCGTKVQLSHVVNMTEDGDKTVVTPSAVTNPFWETFFIDLKHYNDNKNLINEHLNITETQPFQTLFSNLISSTSVPSLPLYVSKTRPMGDGSRLRIRMLSPVSIDAVDAQGRHTGLKSYADSASDLRLKEENIPNSYYEEFGEGKYIGLPADGTYTINLEGLDEGTFTFEIASMGQDGMTKTVSYQNMPVTPSSQGSFTISNGNLDQSILSLDVDGDGVDELNKVVSASSQNPQTHILLIKSLVQSMDVDQKTKRQLLSKFSNVERMITKSDAWDDVDDDGREPVLKKGEKIKERVIKKIDKTSTFVQKQLEKSLKKPYKEEKITPNQAEMLLNLLVDLKVLVQ